MGLSTQPGTRLTLTQPKASSHLISSHLDSTASPLQQLSLFRRPREPFKVLWRVCMSVCLSVCLSAHITRKPCMAKVYRLLCMLPVAVSRSHSSGFVDDVLFSYHGASGPRSSTTLFRRSSHAVVGTSCSLRQDNCSVWLSWWECGAGGGEVSYLRLICWNCCSWSFVIVHVWWCFSVWQTVIIDSQCFFTARHSTGLLIILCVLSLFLIISSHCFASYPSCVCAYMFYYCEHGGVDLMGSKSNQCFDTVGWVIWPIKTRPRYDL